MVVAADLSQHTDLRFPHFVQHRRQGTISLPPDGPLIIRRDCRSCDQPDGHGDYIEHWDYSPAFRPAAPQPPRLHCR